MIARQWRAVWQGPQLRAVGLAAIMVLSAAVASALVVSAAPAAGGAPTVPASSPLSTAAAPSVGPHAASPPPAPSSGRGSFWLNQPVPNQKNGTCDYYYCVNDTGNPSIAANSYGVMLTASTAFTNLSACSASGNLTETEIEISASTTPGGPFGAPTYLNDPGCQDAANYTSAMYPALTTLPNGTFVLAFVEYNMTLGYVCNDWDYFPALGPCYIPLDRLVVSESFNNGTTWTPGQVIVAVNNTALNTTAPIPAQVAIASFGDTVYVSWSNWTNPCFNALFGCTGMPSTGVNLVVSNNSGATFGTPIVLPTVPGAWIGGNSSVAYAPQLAVSSTGELYVAYASNLTADMNTFCQPTGCGFLYGSDDLYSLMSIEVASSTNNGTSFNLSTAGPAVPVYYNGLDTWSWGTTEVSPEPAITVSPSTGEVFVAYTGGEFGTLCYTFGCYYYGYDDFEGLWVVNSTDGGTTWSAPLAIGDNLIGINGASSFAYLFTPSIGVGANNTIYIDAGYANDSVCQFFCGLWTDVIFVSTDGGASFPSFFQPAASIVSTWDYPLWDGFDTSMTVYGGVPFIAWSWQYCPNPITFYCYFGGPGASQVVVSSPFTGAGVTVTFNETGISGTGNWSISLEGNVRAGAWGQNLSVSGVPTHYNLTWDVLPVASGKYGIEYVGNSTPLSPGNFTTSSVVSVDFQEYVQFIVTTVPGAMSTYYPFYCYQGGFTYYDYCTNADVTPTPGLSWLPAGTSVSYGVYIATLPTNCFFCENLSFQAWTGSGWGSWNGSTPNGTTVLHGPVNETASFQLVSACYVSCFNLSYIYTFHETGLPANTTWEVTLGNVTNTSSNQSLTFLASYGPLPFTIWVVPHNATYEYVGTADVPSPIAAVQGSNVTVTFRLVPIDSQSFAATFGESGVPPSASGWGLELGGSDYGIPLAGSTFVLPGASSRTINASAVYGNAGSGAHVTSFEVFPDIVGASSYNVAPGGSLTVDAPTTIVAEYVAEYWLDVPAPANGTINQTSQWVNSGSSVTLTATPNAGYAFVGWSGSGAGSKTSSASTIKVAPTGPVTEIATFAFVPVTYTVTVSATGLPAGTDFTFQLGATTYTGASPITISRVAPGTYPISSPTVVPNGTAGTEYTVTGLTSSLPLAAGQLTVNAAGTVSVTFSTFYELTMNPAVNGTVSPVAGTSWIAAGGSVTITATPNTGFELVNWVGTGSGSYSGTSLSVPLTMSGPISEAATFQLIPPVVTPTFNLVLTPSGLPSGQVWSATIGSQSVTGSGKLTLTGLNGTYTVTVATVSPSAGTEFVPASSGSYSLGVLNATSYTVVFSTLYQVTVDSSSGGVVTPASGWVASGGQLALTATAAAGYVFANWSGTGSGAYSGPEAGPTVTVSAPITEFATFTLAPTTSASSSSGNILVPIAALAALLVVGLVVGLAIARAGGRRPPPMAPAEQAAPSEASPGTGGEVSSYGGDYGGGSADAGAPPSGGVPADEGGGEIVYGGGSS
jgi:hypothetical protein